MSTFLSSLAISHLSDVGLVKIFTHSVCFYFVLLTMSFVLQKLLSFRKSHLLIVAISVCDTSVIFTKFSPVPMHSKLLSSFSSMRFSVVGYTFKSLIHLVWVLCMVIDKDLFSLSTCQHPVMTAPSVKDAFLFTFYNFRFFVKKNQLFIGVWTIIRVFSLIPLIYISVFMPISSRSFSISGGLTYLLMLLLSVLLGLYVESGLLCPCVAVYFLTSLLSD